jgi:23S rRNA pseudouridine2605 synthase
MNGIRLQLLLAKAGIASRRHAEVLIREGHVAVNGRIVTQLGTRVDPVADRISVDGKPVEQEPLAYYLLHKPKGYVTTASDPDGRPTVFDLIPDAPVRLFAVGRLDFNTEGVLLLTNDGELAHALMHPSRGVQKIYHAKFRETLTAAMVSRLQQGVELPPARPLGRNGEPLPVPQHHGPAEWSAPADVEVLKFTSRHTWAEIRLHEGKNRQIHRMAEAVGSSLLKLVRVEYAGLTAAGVEVGQSRPLRPLEIQRLRLMCGLSASLPRAAHAVEEPSRGRLSGSSSSGAASVRAPRDERPEPRSARAKIRGQASASEDSRTSPAEDSRTPRDGSRTTAPRRFEDKPAPRKFEDRGPPQRREDRFSRPARAPRSRPDDAPPPLD